MLAVVVVVLRGGGVRVLGFRHEAWQSGVAAPIHPCPCAALTILGCCLPPTHLNPTHPPTSHRRKDNIDSRIKAKSDKKKQKVQGWGRLHWCWR